jgi:hypothetical protein
MSPVNPQEPVLVQQVPLSWQAQVADLLKKQGPISLLAVVAVYFMWAQINEDRSAYETRQKEREVAHAIVTKEIAVENSKAIEKLALQQTVQLKDQADAFGREQDRTERILGNKINLNAKRVDEVNKKVDQLVP